VKNRIRNLRGYSREMSSQMPDQLDFAFVDGDHSWEGIKTDWTIISGRCFRAGWFASMTVSLRPGKIGDAWIPACTLKK